MSIVCLLPARIACFSLSFVEIDNCGRLRLLTRCRCLFSYMSHGLYTAIRDEQPCSNLSHIYVMSSCQQMQRLYKGEGSRCLLYPSHITTCCSWQASANGIRVGQVETRLEAARYSNRTLRTQFLEVPFNSPVLAPAAPGALSNT
jgi:hypothetical protein